MSKLRITGLLAAESTGDWISLWPWLFQGVALRDYVYGQFFHCICHFGWNFVLEYGFIFTMAHYCDVMMGAMAPRITSLTIVYGADERKHQSSVSLAFVPGIRRWPVNSPHKWTVTRKLFPFDDVTMGKWQWQWWQISGVTIFSSSVYVMTLILTSFIGI